MIIRKLYRFVCLLDLNELPLRHFVENLYFEPTGMNTLSGQKEKKLINFEPLPSDLF